MSKSNPLDHCRSVDYSGACDSCESGFVAVNGTCHRCPQHCNDCYYSNPKNCTTCKEGYGKTSNGGCKPCLAKHCKDCHDNYSKCSSCRRGFSFDSKAKTCSPCNVKHCSTCSSPGLCTHCEEGYGVTDSFQCTRCPNYPYHCNSGGARCGCDCGYVLSPRNTTCFKCPDNCEGCDEHDPSQCTECQDGYFLTSKKKCASCSVPHCSYCDSGAHSTCLECQEGYLESSDGTACLLIPENCSKVADTGKCSECWFGYGFDEKGSCRPCSTQQCDSCSKDYSVCDYCIDKYGFTNTPGRQKCLPCRSKNCLHCSANYALCERCDDKYALGKSSKFVAGSCLKCPDHCDECHISSSGKTLCDLCECNSVQACFGVNSSTGACTACKPCLYTCERSEEGCWDYLGCC